MKQKLNKKRKLLLLAIITIILIISVLIVFYFINKNSLTISGEWEMIVNPEITESDEGDNSQKVYYTFSVPGKYGDGKYKTIFDGGIEEGDFKLSEKEGKSYINMGTDDLEYKIVGSELTITYSGDETENYVFIRTKAPDYEKESYESFETDRTLIAEWITEERTLSYYSTELSYTESVEFLENGIMIINYKSEDLMLDRDMYYAYTAENNTLIFSPVTDKETKYEVSYIFDKEGNLKFENDETSSCIFADAFFSDVTYRHK